MDKEYIEREKAIGIMCDGCNIEFSDEPCEPNDCRLYRGIREMPAADVVEVVRCKNCEHLTKKGICDKFRQRYPFYPEADFHCGFGNRKEGTE